MNMSTKEIARINGLSVRAVENKRYRLRKKLSLNTDTSLESFVESVEDWLVYQCEYYLSTELVVKM